MLCILHIRENKISLVQKLPLFASNSPLPVIGSHDLGRLIKRAPQRPTFHFIVVRLPRLDQLGNGPLQLIE